MKAKGRAGKRGVIVRMYLLWQQCLGLTMLRPTALAAWALDVADADTV